MPIRRRRIRGSKYPIYIISKGRADSRLTSKALEEIGQPYKIVVEPVDYDDYAFHIDPSKILILPFSDLGQGSIPARNWVLDHAIESGAKKHWIMDDNIKSFFRLNKNTKIKLMTRVFFNIVEDFFDRYENVAMAGLNYFFLCSAGNKIPPFYLNTRIYSCILLSHNHGFRWRGRYNEDTDLSLRILKNGWCTILMNSIICGKVPTLQMGGGNTDNVYTDDDKRKKFAQSLVDQHPDCVKMTYKFNRWHHQVDYRIFKRNKLIKKEGLIIPKGVNNYGLTLIDKTDPDRTPITKFHWE